MSLMEATLGTAIGVPVYDYLSVTGSAARFTSFEYRYWPPSKLRWSAIGLLAAGVFVTLAIMRAPEPDDRFWVIVPALVGLAVHWWVSVIDMFRQRRAAVRNMKVS